MASKRKVIPRIEILKRGQRINTLLLNTPRLVIGSAAGAHIRLRSPEIETEHLVIELVNRRFLEAVNVSGDPHLRHQGETFERVRLGKGSVITLGQLAFRLSFVARAIDSADDEAPPPPPPRSSPTPLAAELPEDESTESRAIAPLSSDAPTPTEPFAVVPEPAPPTPPSGTPVVPQTPPREPAATPADRAPAPQPAAARPPRAPTAAPATTPMAPTPPHPPATPAEPALPADRVVFLLVYPPTGERRKRVKLPVGSFDVGRENCDITLHHAGVADRHATLMVMPDGNVYVKDAGSGLPTIVNGQVTDLTPFVSGDKLQIGTVSFALEVFEPRPAGVAAASAGPATPDTTGAGAWVQAAMGHGGTPRERDPEAESFVSLPVRRVSKRDQPSVPRLPVGTDPGITAKDWVRQAVESTASMPVDTPAPGGGPAAPRPATPAAPRPPEPPRAEPPPAAAPRPAPQHAVAPPPVAPTQAPPPVAPPQAPRPVAPPQTPLAAAGPQGPVPTSPAQAPASPPPQAPALVERSRAQDPRAVAPPPAPRPVRAPSPAAVARPSAAASARFSQFATTTLPPDYRARKRRRALISFLVLILLAGAVAIAVVLYPLYSEYVGFADAPPRPAVGDGATPPMDEVLADTPGSYDGLRSPSSPPGRTRGDRVRSTGAGGRTTPRSGTAAGGGGERPSSGGRDDGVAMSEAGEEFVRTGPVYGPGGRHAGSLEHGEALAGAQYVHVDDPDVIAIGNPGAGARVVEFGSSQLGGTMVEESDGGGVRRVEELEFELADDADPGARGEVDMRAVEAVLYSITPNVRMCHQRALETRPELEGTMVLILTLSTSGQIVGVGLDMTGSTLTDTDLKRCIERQVRAKNFPIPRGGQVTFSYPFRFAR